MAKCSRLSEAAKYKRLRKSVADSVTVVATERAVRSLERQTAKEAGLVEAATAAGRYTPKLSDEAVQ